MKEFCGTCGTEMDLSISDVCPICGEKAGASKPKTVVTETTSGDYGGFWIRLIAFFIDGLVLLIPFAFFIGLVGIQDIGFLYFLCLITAFVYSVFLESSSWQATVGKAAMGLKVVDMEGARISVQQAAVRYIGKILSALILYIGFIMIGFTENKQGLHDMIAQTFVVRK
jgi:uncharacterized RDD family membrane protein YckC